jgi:hypothetical protein
VTGGRKEEGRGVRTMAEECSGAERRSRRGVERGRRQRERAGDGTTEASVAVFIKAASEDRTGQDGTGRDGTTGASLS